MRFILSIALLFAVLDGMNCQVLGGFSNLNASEYTGTAWKSVPEINSNSIEQNYMVPIKVYFWWKA
ncbi:Cystatin [Caenorhabditis elegans]|uniref:Cystatin n=1 Tax=Caenorhabditis elegans TaxID=6239 RepID=Q688A2_CAEEL|nr:Cystatin [Caenorhabditis elegans]CCD72382.1 Cystatin [Caenorhabditis elegans]|eukprot:NP_001023280.1 Cystatin [Caenorhabditis elegans]